MPRRSLTANEIAAFRERAITAVAKLFASRGAEGVTMRALAKELGCSPMTPYHYFDNQEHLLAAARTRAFEDLAAAQRLASEGPGDALQRIRRARRAYIAFAVENPELYRLMFFALPPKESYAELTSAWSASFAPLREAVVSAVAERTIEGDVDVIAHLLWSEMHGLVSLHLSDKLNFGCSLSRLVEHSLLDL